MAKLAVVMITLVTAVRLAALLLPDFDLDGDEAQYWWWAQQLDFGYYSKPPLIAWLIALSTSVCGDGEACVRVTSPLLYAAASGILFVLARRLYDARTAFWASVTFLTLPGVTFSAALITTDVPLLFFWSVALLCFVSALEGRPRAALWLGVAIGLGMLSKYAMIYFVGSALLFCALTPRARWFLASRAGAVTVTTALLILAPNVIWNVEHHFATMGHTVGNAAWTSSWLHPGAALGFLSGQLGVFGPLLFPILLVLAWGTFGPHRNGPEQQLDRGDRLMLWFALPVLVLVTLQALRSRAFANWAAVAYPSASVVVAARLLRRGHASWLKASLGLHLVLAVGLYALFVWPTIPTRLGIPDPLAKVRGWDELAAGVARELDRHPEATLGVDDRMTTAEMLYYLRRRDPVIRKWDLNGISDDHFEMTMPFDPDESGPVLMLSGLADPSPFREAFEDVRSLGTVDKPAGPFRTRTYHLFLLRVSEPSRATSAAGRPSGG